MAGTASVASLHHEIGSQMKGPQIANATAAQATRPSHRHIFLGTFYGVIFLHVPSRQEYQHDMCLYLNQILGYIGRSLLRPCCRGRKEEKVLADNKAEKSGYCRRSDFETPPTQATGVRPQPKWHGASEDAIMNVIRYQQERKAEGAFERPPYVKRGGSIAESLGDQESCYCFFFKLFCYCIPV
jgi:hypothetical protein